MVPALSSIVLLLVRPFLIASITPTGPTTPAGPTNPTAPTNPTNPTTPTAPTNPRYDVLGRYHVRPDVQTTIKRDQGGAEAAAADSHKPVQGREAAPVYLTASQEEELAIAAVDAQVAALADASGGAESVGVDGQSGFTTIRQGTLDLSRTQEGNGSGPLDGTDHETAAGSQSRGQGQGQGQGQGDEGEAFLGSLFGSQIQHWASLQNEV